MKGPISSTKSVKTVFSNQLNRKFSNPIERISNKFQFDFTPNSNPIPKISEPDASEFFRDKSEKQLILSIFQADDMGHYV